MTGSPRPLGESIAVAGVCLTVVEFDARGFSADVSVETLSLIAVCVAPGDPLARLERLVRPFGVVALTERLERPEDLAERGAVAAEDRKSVV